MFFPHNEIIIFGHEIAEKGVHKYIDFFTRDPEPRRSVWILVAKDKASEVLESKPNLEKIPAQNISHLVEEWTATSQISAVNLQEFLASLMSKTTAPVASHIEISGEGKEKKVRLSGTAVFKKDKLVGQLHLAETRGLLWVTGKVKSGIIDVACPNDKGKASLEIIRTDSKITPEIKDNKIHITVKIYAEGNLGSQMCSANLASLPAWTVLEKRQA